MPHCLVRRLPGCGRDHQLGEPAAGFGRVPAVDREPGEVVGQRGEGSGWPVSASGSAADWVTTITCPWWERPRWSIARARLAAMCTTPPNSSSSSVHGAPATCAAAYMSASARTVIIGASLGISSTCVRRGRREAKASKSPGAVAPRAHGHRRAHERGGGPAKYDVRRLARLGLVRCAKTYGSRQLPPAAGQVVVRDSH